MRSLFLTLTLAAASLGLVAVTPERAPAQGYFYYPGYASSLYLNPYYGVPSYGYYGAPSYGYYYSAPRFGTYYGYPGYTSYYVSPGYQSYYYVPGYGSYYYAQQPYYRYFYRYRY